LNIFLDGWDVFKESAGGIFVFFITVFGLGWAVSRVFVINAVREEVAKLLLVLSLGCFSLLWISLSLVLLGRIHPNIFFYASRVLPWISAGVLIFEAVRFIRNGGRAASMRNISVLFVLVFAPVFFLRLAFISDLLLPQYDDSPEHYMIVQDLVDPLPIREDSFYALGNISENYYHLGFHFLSAWFSVSSGMDIARSILLLGQIFVFLSAIFVAFLILVLTENYYGAAASGLYAALAWEMPAFAVNWGKYPAIVGIALFPAALGILIILGRYQFHKASTWILWLAVILGAGLLHTRLIVCLGIFLVVYLLSRIFPLKGSNRLWQIIIVAGGISILWLFRNSLLVFYANNLFLPLIFIVVLLPLAWMEFHQATFQIIFSTLGLSVASRVPLWLEGYGAFLMNAQFLEIFLYIPLASLIGVGLAGLFKQEFRFSIWIKCAAVAIAVVGLLYDFPSKKAFSPDLCCTYVNQGDLQAIQWIRNHSSEDSAIWIPAFKPGKYKIGTDAGVWIPALANRNANKLAYDFDWKANSARETLCQVYYSEVYVYAGSTQFSFDVTALQAVEWLELTFSSGDTQIYAAACKDQ